MTEINKKQNLIAPDFKPTFRSCDLAVFCNNPTPKAKINFLIKRKIIKTQKKPDHNKRGYFLKLDK